MRGCRGGNPGSRLIVLEDDMTSLESNVPPLITACLGSRTINISGMTFGRLTVLSAERRGDSGKLLWRCRCSCGNETVVRGSHLRVGATKSCGCFNRELMLSKFASHGHTRGKKNTTEYNTWSSMKKRCLDPASKDYKNYGGRGISVCERWLHSFEAFFEDMGKKPTGLSIERKNVNGNYEPGNCKWATRDEQNNNRRPRSVCWKGHPLTKDNVRGPKRRCKTCHEECVRNYREAQRAKRRQAGA